MIELEFLKNLHFSSASGLVRLGEKFCTISDDQLALEIFTIAESEASSFFSLFPGKLPLDAQERKRLKPDLEALVFLADPGTLLAVPSGSKKNRRLGAMVSLLEDQSLAPTSIPVDFSSLFEHLGEIFSELNIEGAIVVGRKLKLFQRGNGLSAQNAIIDLDFQIFVEELVSKHQVSSRCFQSVSLIKLPQINGVSLSFTDAAVLSNAKDSPLWFLAAAEKTDSPFDDGPFLGAILGCLNSRCELIFHAPLSCSEKPEGLWLDFKSSSFYVVTDADDRAKPSRLLRGTLPRL